MPERANSLPVLVCLPHAGGAATTFRTWGQHFDGVARVVGLEPPGRGARRAEALPRTMKAVVESLKAPLANAIDGHERIGLLGHSFGALVARELADVLAEGGRPIDAFVTLGRNAPTLPSDSQPIAGLPDDGLIEAVLALGGVPDELRDEPELLNLMLGPLRSDLRIAERHLRPRSLHTMACPLLSLQGADDPVVSPHGVRAWREETAGKSTITWCPGGHFFHTDPEFLRSTLRPLVERMLAP